jgi:hypothetical protein
MASTNMRLDAAAITTAPPMFGFRGSSHPRDGCKKIAAKSGDHCAERAATMNAADGIRNSRCHPRRVTENAKTQADRPTNTREAANSFTRVKGIAATRVVIG